MDSKCSHCIELVESAFSSEPHHQLRIQRSSPQASIYRCNLCSTMFEFTEHEIFLLEVQTATVPLKENEKRSAYA